MEISIALILLIMLFSSRWLGIYTYKYDAAGKIIGIEGVRSLWDLFDLLIIPIVLGAAGLWFSHVQKRTELKIALERQRQQTLENYFDRMADLILKEGLGSDSNKSVIRLAMTYTLTAIRDLDAKRNKQVIQFLQELKLLNVVVYLIYFWLLVDVIVLLVVEQLIFLFLTVVLYL